MTVQNKKEKGFLQKTNVFRLGALGNQSCSVSIEAFSLLIWKVFGEDKFTIGVYDSALDDLAPTYKTAPIKIDFDSLSSLQELRDSIDCQRKQLEKKDMVFDGLLIQSSTQDFCEKHIRSFITLYQSIDNEEIRCFIQFDANFYNSVICSHLPRYYSHLYNLCMKEIESFALKDILLFNDAYFNELIYSRNNTEVPFHEKKLMHQLFEEQVIKTPEHVALIAQNNRLSYLELNERANKIAHFLANSYQVQGKAVAVISDRDIDMVIYLLAVLKAGAFYVPIEPMLPYERMRSIFISSGVVGVLTLQKYLAHIPSEKDLFFICADKKNISEFDIKERHVVYSDEMNLQSKENLFLELPSTALAYVIFTSGTTGNPKGVMVCHKTVMNVIEWINNTFAVHEKDKLLCVASISFDLSVYDIFGCLAAGAAVRIANKDEIRDPYRLHHILHTEQITIWDSAPPVLQQVASYFDDNLVNSYHLRLIMLSGDWISLGLPPLLQKMFPKATILAMGGATEATIWSNYYIIDKIKEGWKSIPYGKPIQNAKYYVLDEFKNPLPAKIPGELYIGGDCLAMGYIGDDTLTREKFVENPFISGQKMYRTGDAACWMEDGNIELLGRIDNQVKIRGYRVELGEIQCVLNSHPQVADCLVHVEKDIDNDNRLVAYILAKTEEIAVDEEQMEYIDGWKMVFDAAYKEKKEVFDTKTNFDGWLSSYTNEPIPKEHMIEWHQHTLDLILSLKPERVMEIGCGTGLLLLNLAENCSLYDACDLSESSVQYLHKAIGNHPLAYSNVRLECCGAHDMAHRSDTIFDTVIMNSVVQYFPSIEYLSDVIENVINQVSEGGRVMIGDVRNYDLADLFYLSLRLFKNPDILPEKIAADSFRKEKSSEKELLISPRYFIELAKTNAKISSVEILEKKGVYESEMNLFRYDVILYIGTIMNESDVIVKEANASLTVLDKEYINKMIEKDQILVLRDIEKPKIRELNAIFTNSEMPVKQNIDINTVFHVFSNDYELCPFWSESAHEGYCHIAIGPPNKKINISPLLHVSHASDYKVDYHNIPIQDEKKYIELREIQDYLRKKLPEYMIPQKIFQIDMIPVTENGKVDWKSLGSTSKELSIDIDMEAPVTNTECKLMNIWKKTLKTNHLGIHSNFFEYGGHSLRASMMCLEISKEFNIHIAVDLVFQHPTIKQIAERIEKAANQPKLLKPFKKSKITRCKATSEQTRLYLIQQHLSNNNMYNVTDITYLEGALNVSKLNESIHTVTERHQAFRTCFHFDGEVVYQEIKPLTWNNIEIIDCAKDEWRTHVKALDREFPLNHEPLYRCALLRVSPTEHYLVLVVHHVIMDGVSLGIIKNEISQLYNGKLPKDSMADYIDYSLWQENYLQSDVLNKQREYWKMRFADISFSNVFITDFPKHKQNTYKGRVQTIKLTSNQYEKLKQMAIESNTSLFAALLSIQYVLMHKFSGNEDIVIGTVTANRTHPDFKDVVGMFVNTLPIRATVAPDTLFKDFLIYISALLREDIANQSCPLSDILEDLSDTTGFGFETLFSTVLVLQNMELEPFQFHGIHASKMFYHNTTAKFDITFCFNQFKNSLELELEYSAQLYADSTIKNIIHYYMNILDQVITSSSIPICHIELEEKIVIDSLYMLLNNTSKGICVDSVIEAISRKASEHVNKNAFIYKGETLTYYDLHENSDAFARWLQNLGLQTGDVVATISDASFRLFIAWLGILKANCAFLPIDPLLPDSRISYMLKDSGAKVFISNTNIDLGDPSILSFNFSSYLEEDTKIEKPYQKNAPADLAYVIYTSGSSGFPKGVQVSHLALYNLCKWHIDYYKVSFEDNASKYAGISFDASIWEIFPYLMSGATIHIIEEDIKLDMYALNQYFEENNISISFLPTQVCESFLDVDNCSLRCLLTGGDKLRSYKKQNYKLYNNYGPSENAVVALSYLVENQSPNIPIGKPIYNCQVYVWDPRGSVQPINVPGELVIGGDSLAVGYVNKPELTKEKFVEFKKGNVIQRLYKTGDLVRLNTDKNIEFLGRIDNQVKIRGYRIELREIEYHLLNCPQIRDAIVLCPKDERQETALHCFYVATQQLTAIEIQNYLRERLPVYMLPQTYTRLDTMPLTANGKIDQNRLLFILEQKEHETISSLCIYSNEEKIVLDAFKKVLVNVNISKHSNFLHLGGDSIKAMRIISELHKKNLRLTVKNLFESPTISQLALILKSYQNIYDQNPIVGEVPLLGIQRWFFSRHHRSNCFFNMSASLQFPGQLNENALHQALHQLFTHHDVLRSTFSQNGSWKMMISNDDEIHYAYQKFFIPEDTMPNIDLLNSVQSAISVEDNTLTSIAVFQYREYFEVLVVVHHLLIDGYSIHILLEDLSALYTHAIDGTVHALPLKTASLIKWSNELISRTREKMIKKEIEYWQDFYSKQMPLKLFSTYPITATFMDTDTQRFFIHSTLTKQLIASVNKNHETEDMLVSAVVFSIYKIFNEETIVMNLEGYGRNVEFLDIDMSRTIGWLTSKYPVRFDLQRNPTISQCFSCVYHTLRKVPSEGVFHDVLLYTLEHGHIENMAKTFYPHISFNYLGQTDSWNAFRKINPTPFPESQKISQNIPLFFPIDINCWLVQNQVEVNIRYDKSIYDATVIDCLRKEMEQSLRKLIKFFQSEICGSSSMTNQELEDLLNFVEIEI